MKVVVTGGAGFIGSHVVDTLLARGHFPIVIDDFSSGSRKNLPSEVPVFAVDIRDREKLSSIFAETRPEGLVHLAAQMSVSRSMREPAFDAEVNVIGLLNVFDIAAHYEIQRIVFASSGGALYGDVNDPVAEEAPKRPISAYGISKWVGEQYLEFYARERGIKGVALRFSNVYGPRQNPHGEAGVIAIFCQRMLSGETTTIHGDGHDIRDYVYGPDVALANVLALEKPLKNSFTAINISTGTGTDVNEISAQILQHTKQYLKTRGRTTSIPASQHGPARHGDLRSNQISPLYAEKILGWRPQVPLSEGLSTTIRWFDAGISPRTLV